MAQWPNMQVRRTSPASNSLRCNVSEYKTAAHIKHNYGLCRSNENHFWMTRRRRKINLKQIKLQVHFRRKCFVCVCLCLCSAAVQTRETKKQKKQPTTNNNKYDIYFSREDRTEHEYGSSRQSLAFAIKPRHIIIICAHAWALLHLLSQFGMNWNDVCTTSIRGGLHHSPNSTTIIP